MKALLPLLACLGLAACGAPPPPPPGIATRAAPGPAAINPVKSFSAPHPAAPMGGNDAIARDFLDLSFALESGRALPVLTRFEGPISVQLTGRAVPGIAADLSRLLARLRREAGIDIRQVGALPSGQAAGVTIEVVRRSDIRRVLPQAACFVVPNVSSLREYAAARSDDRVNWALLRDRRRLAIFLPGDVSPQEARDCLHEELAQAIGPLNDLYRLPDSVFNDDNVHTVLTGFDMTILRAYYDPALHNGMTRAQVAARLPAILARINPRGEGRASPPVSPTPAAWTAAIQSALGPGAGMASRRIDARRAVDIAARLGWQDSRRAFGHYALGRLLQPTHPDAALAQFRLADRYYAASPETRLHRAYVAVQLAAHALRGQDPRAALDLLAPHFAIARRYENAALLATLMLLRAEALDMTGRPSEARALRLDSLGWARYGFGGDWEVRSKLREIASLRGPG